MHKTMTALSAFLLFCCSAAALAADSIKPGLWEMTMTSDAMKAMPKLSPEQMEMMRKAGVNMPQMLPGGIVSKVCISKEMAQRGQPPMAQNESGCETKNYRRSGNAYSMDMVCDGPRMKGSGAIKGTYQGDSSFSSTFDFKGVAQGRPVDQHTATSGKWLGADCGGIKPLASPARK